MDLAATLVVLILGIGIGAALTFIPARLLLLQERRTREASEGLVGSVGEQLREAFQALSAEALHRNNRTFLELATVSLGEFKKGAEEDLEGRQKAIDALVAPINEALGQVDTKLKAIEKERHGHYERLTEQLRAVGMSQEKLQGETRNLVTALRAPSVRGRWGEIQLKRVVEMAGMLEHCDFHQQATVDSDQGRLRPDLVVRLPGGKNVIVDAKAPLEAFLQSLESSDDAVREQKLKAHARQVRAHMATLGAKSYWAQFEPTPEFVVMFLPGETFFSTALEHDPSLIEYGVDQRVIPASPTTLIALLRAVAYGWRQERLTENAHEISQLGRVLYERIAKLTENFGKVGTSLGRAVSAYNETVGTLESRVLVSARRFKEMGAGGTADLPTPSQIDRAARTLRTDDEGSA